MSKEMARVYGAQGDTLEIARKHIVKRAKEARERVRFMPGSKTFLVGYDAGIENALYEIDLLIKTCTDLALKEALK